MKNIFILALCVYISGCEVNYSSNGNKNATLQHADTNYAIEALNVSSTFLDKLDSGQEEATWSLLSDNLKNDVSESTWSTTLSVMRKTTGNLIMRDAPKIGYSESLPDATPGKYYVFDYQAKFKNMEVDERVVASFEVDEWTIAGYFMTKRYAVTY